MKNFLLITATSLLTVSGHSQFGPRQTINNAANARCIIPVDLDGDGDHDLVGGYDNTIAWFENFQDDSLGNAQLISSWDPGSPEGLAAADLDGDGDTDLLSAGAGQLGWHENNGDGTFAAVVNFPDPNGWQYYEVATADLDNDGDPDVIAGGTSTIQWFENLGSGNFGGGLQIAVVSGESSIAVGDMDNDGFADVLAGGYNGIKLLHNEGDGSFSVYWIIDIAESEGVTSMAVGDVDGDGLTDLAVTCYATSELQLFRNMPGVDQFSPKQVIRDYGNISADQGVQIVDLNDDGLNDILTGFYNVIEWYENSGAGSFESTSHVIGNEASRFAGAADLDGDGDLEVLTAASPGGLGWFENFFYGNNKVRGRVFADLNGNGVWDAGDLPLGHTGIMAVPQSDFTFTFLSGEYFMNFTDTSGVYTIAPQDVPHWSVTTDSLSYLVYIDNEFAEMDSLDFGLQPDSLITEMEVQLIGGFPRCNTVVNYWIDLHNTGTTVTSGVITIELDPSIQYQSAVPSPDSVNGQHVYWHYDDLNYFAHQQLQLSVEMPDFQSMGDTLVSVVTVDAEAAGLVTTIFTDTLSQILACAYDPNDKTVSPAGVGAPGYIVAGTDFLEYTIRFQNTGNDTAMQVRIADQLDADLDWSSLEILAWSHPVEVSGDQNGLVSFLFDDIFLPDSNVNELASHGFIRYRIRLNPGLLPGAEISNTAYIYFDQNPPVITNTTLNTIYNCVTAEIALFEEDTLCADAAAIGLPEAEPAGGVFSGTGISGDQFQPSVAGPGEHTVYYTYSGINCLTVDSLTILVEDCLGLKELPESFARIFPNPVTTHLTVLFPAEGRYEMTLCGIAGNRIWSGSVMNAKTHTVDVGSLANGMYLFHILNTDTRAWTTLEVMKN